MSPFSHPFVQLLFHIEKFFGQGAVEVIPPVADGFGLVENGLVGTKPGVFGDPKVVLVETDVERLALRLWIPVKPTNHMTVVAGKGRVRDDRVDRKVLSSNSLRTLFRGTFSPSAPNSLLSQLCYFLNR